MLWDIFFTKGRYECWTGHGKFGHLRQHTEVIYKGLCNWDLDPGVSGKPSTIGHLCPFQVSTVFAFSSMS